jgi:hypothetical protein
MPNYAEGPNFIFLHIGRTAGCSIRKALGIKEPFSPQCHERAIDARKRVGEDVFTSKFIFTFVRNPWDRLVSEFHHHKSQFSHMSFSEWLPQYIDDTIDGKNKGYRYPQGDFITDEYGELIVNYIGMFESLPESWYALFPNLDANLLIGGLSKQNQSKHAHYRHYYKKHSMYELVKEWDKKIIEVIGYEF